jgi:hypothetical protein
MTYLHPERRRTLRLIRIVASYSISASADQ